MIHVLGMSHAISVLRAIDPDWATDHFNWNTAPERPQWCHIQAPGQGGRPLRCFLITPAMQWHAQLRVDGSEKILAATPGYWQALEDLQPQEGDTLFSFIGGNDHSVLSLLEHEQPFDFADPQHPQLPMLPGRQPIPRTVIEETLRHRTNPTIAMLTAIRHRYANLHIVHTMPPPPLASEARIRRDTEAYFKDRIDQRGITPLSVRLKVYHAYVRFLAEECQALRIETLPPPDAALDKCGALLDDFSLGCTHGNNAYGQLVARQMRQLLEA